MDELNLNLAQHADWRDRREIECQFADWLSSIRWDIQELKDDILSFESAVRAILFGKQHDRS